ncbi:MAG: CPBP family intramembrane glutamic endopeptidase [Marinirhabdus sp.]|nr:CPBP family intramembrane glutamic endopeptidase [Marinirhabdus sp.]
MNKIKTLQLEFLVLFVLLPISLVLDYPVSLKVTFVGSATVYVLFQLRQLEAVRFKIKGGNWWLRFFKRLAGLFVLVMLLTTTYVWQVDQDMLFYVPLNSPKLFVTIALVYTLFSVWPQEVIFRTFFFERYGILFQNKTIMVFVNAVVFSLAHLFFRNVLVLVLTFVGGLLFGLTYIKYRSTTAVTIEHALYGNWLFTVGMGQMLAFPGMEN